MTQKEKQKFPKGYLPPKNKKRRVNKNVIKNTYKVKSLKMNFTHHYANFNFNPIWKITDNFPLITNFLIIQCSIDILWTLESKDPLPSCFTSTLRCFLVIFFCRPNSLKSLRIQISTFLVSFSVQFIFLLFAVLHCPCNWRPLRCFIFGS